MNLEILLLADPGFYYKFILIFPMVVIIMLTLVMMFQGRFFEVSLHGSVERLAYTS